METKKASSQAYTLSAGPTGALLLLIWLCLLVSLGVSGYLASGSLGQGITLAGCEPGSSCDVVLSSRWAKVAGVPISILATLMYLFAAWQLYRATFSATAAARGRAWVWLTGIAIIALGAALWFTLLQWVYIGEFCPYCMVAHGAGATFGFLIIAMAPIAWGIVDDAFEAAKAKLLSLEATANAPAAAGDDGASKTAQPQKLTLVSGGAAVGALALGMFALIVMAVLQMALPGPSYAVVRTTDAGSGTHQLPADAPDGTRMMNLGSTGQVAILPREHPSIGSPEATHIMVYLFDYTCPHCRLIHPFLKQAASRYGDQLGFMVLPMPFNADCNPMVIETEPRHKHACHYATLSLAVWRASSNDWLAFHNFLMDSDDAPTPEAARAQAEAVLGDAAAVDAALADPWIPERFVRSATLYDLTGRGPIPKLIGDGTSIVGRPDTAERFFRVIESELGIAPKASAAAPAATE